MLFTYLTINEDEGIMVLVVMGRSGNCCDGNRCILGQIPRKPQVKSIDKRTEEHPFNEIFLHDLKSGLDLNFDTVSNNTQHYFKLLTDTSDHYPTASFCHS